MEMADSPAAALRALHTSLQSEREWRNIQKTVLVAVGRLVAVATAQQQRLDAVVDHITHLETARDQQQDALTALRSSIASELKDAMHENQAQLTERVCAHVDARLATQRDELELNWTKNETESNQTRRSDLDALHKQLTREMEEMLTRSGSSGGEDGKLNSMERKLKRLEKQLRATESEFTAEWIRWREKITQKLESKVSHGDLTAALGAQSERLESVRGEIHSNSADWLTRLATQRDIQTRVDAELTQLKTNMHELLGIVERLQGEQTVLKTLTIDHVQQQNGTTSAGDDHAHDTKRAVLQLHDAVQSVRRSVESVAKRAELEALSEQVAWIRKQLRSEIYHARYIWKEGRPTHKQTIAWTTQVVNTNSDVFVWQRSLGDAVTTMVPGLYHLQAAFFTSLEPVLQVLVNGEPALILTSSANDATGTTENQSASLLNRELPLSKPHSMCHHGRRRLHHSGGDIVGLEISAFLALPARAVIKIGYDIDEGAQGFLNLRKL